MDSLDWRPARYSDVEDMPEGVFRFLLSIRAKRAEIRARYATDKAGRPH